jgi:hypothetical protein
VASIDAPSRAGGERPTAAPQPDRRPRLGPAPRRRQPALTVLGLVVMLACGAVFGALMLRTGGRVAVLAVAREVPPGQVLTEQDLREVRVAADAGVALVPSGERDAVVGRFAAVRLLPGSLLPPSAVTPQPIPPPGYVKVGLRLRPGQVPAEPLSPGDLVAVVAASPEGGSGAGDTAASGAEPGELLVEEATVFGQRATEGSGDTIVSLIVPEDDYQQVIRYGDGRASLAVLPPKAVP